MHPQQDHPAEVENPPAAENDVAPPAANTDEGANVSGGPGACVICQHPLLLPGEEQQALECMHVFHKKCITEYIDTIGKPARFCCPFKCFKDSD